MKIKETKNKLNSLSRDELIKEQGKLHAETLELRVKQSSGQLENPARLRTIRRTVARIQTLLNASAKSAK